MSIKNIGQLKSFKLQNSNQINISKELNTKLYSGIDVEKIIKDVRKSFSKSDLVKPLGRGSTGRTIANNWKERKAMIEVMRNPYKGKVLDLKMTDPKWHTNKGWVKMARNIDKVEIHWVKNEITGAVDDFKFKNK
jgi:hypothetical protein